MRSWQANFGRGVPVAVFVENLDRLLEAGGPRALYALQEIDEADKPEEMDILRRRVRDTHHVVGEHTAVPILVPFHLELADALVTPACKGLALFTPNRVINEAVIQLGPNLAVAVENTHLPRLPDDVSDEVRQELTNRRTDVRKALRTRTRAHDAGVWVADTNTRRGWPTIAKGEKTVTDAGIDKAKAWVLPGRKIRITDRRTVNLTIDGHDAHGARVWWTAA